MESISDNYLADDPLVTRVFDIEINGSPRAARQQPPQHRCPPTERCLSPRRSPPLIGTRSQASPRCARPPKPARPLGPVSSFSPLSHRNRQSALTGLALLRNAVARPASPAGSCRHVGSWRLGLPGRNGLSAAGKQRRSTTRSRRRRSPAPRGSIAPRPRGLPRLGSTRSRGARAGHGASLRRSPARPSR